MNSRGCPSPSELSEFLTGNLSEPLFENIADHVAHCPECEKAIDAYDDALDSVVFRLRQSPEGTPSVNRPLPEELLHALRAIRPKEEGFAFLPGLHRLGKFELLEELGIGSFGCVLRAH